MDSMTTLPGACPGTGHYGGPAAEWSVLGQAARLHQMVDTGIDFTGSAVDLKGITQLLQFMVQGAAIQSGAELPIIQITLRSMFRGKLMTHGKKGFPDKSRQCGSVPR